MHGHNTHKYIFHLDEAWSWMNGTGSMSPMAIDHQRPTRGRIQCAATPIASDNIMKISVGATAYIGPPAKPIPKEIYGDVRQLEVSRRIFIFPGGLDGKVGVQDRITCSRAGNWVHVRLKCGVLQPDIEFPTRGKRDPESI
jgi:hypothetical protein